MTDKQKQEYVDAIVEGYIPDQETFTKEEVKYLIGTTLAWCAEQIDHTIGEAKHEDIEELCSVCEWKSQEEAIADVQSGWEDKFLQLKDFVLTWIA